MATMLAFEKRLVETAMHEPWERRGDPGLGTLTGKPLGLVGLGGIGAALAERALPFGMRVLALRRRPRPSEVPGVELASDLGELLREADHLVLAAPATAATHHLIDRDALAQVKPGVHLVNVARGTLLDQEALRAALDDGRVAMASLDTIEPEPLPAGHWLYSHPRARNHPSPLVEHAAGTRPDRRYLHRESAPLPGRRTPRGRRGCRGGLLSQVLAVARSGPAHHSPRT